MTKNLWQRERQAMFRELVRQYQDEGYNTKAAKKYAKQEINEIMEDKESFVQEIWNQTYEDT